MTRKIEVKRTDKGWWDFPWIATLYENGHFVTLAIGSTRWGAIKGLKRKIAIIDKPPSEEKVLYREEIPFEEL